LFVPDKFIVNVVYYYCYKYYLQVYCIIICIY